MERNLVAKHDFNKGGAHRSLKDYARERPNILDCWDEYEDMVDEAYHYELDNKADPLGDLSKTLL